jgi:flagellar export protein FliJ
MFSCGPFGPAQEPAASSDNRAVTGTSFRFRLERVRVVRERKEKLAQLDLVDAMSRRSSTVAELRTADADLEHARAEQRSAVSSASALSGDDLIARQAFLERVEAQRRLRAYELEQREAEVAERDAALTTAASEHEMLNRLRERYRGEHDREAARVERNTLDEIAVTRFGRGSA